MGGGITHVKKWRDDFMIGATTAAHPVEGIIRIVSFYL